MKILDPDKLSVQYRPGVTAHRPIIGRRYTLTHSDTTGELFLTIARRFAYDEIGPMRDEVLAEWRCEDDTYGWYVYVFVGGPFSRRTAAERYRIFRQELPLALEALRYGDRQFFRRYPELDASPIMVYFDSTYPEFNHWEEWGSPSDYR